MHLETIADARAIILTYNTHTHTRTTGIICKSAPLSLLAHWITQWWIFLTPSSPLLLFIGNYVLMWLRATFRSVFNLTQPHPS